jgi:hypothetical protein
VGFRGISSGSSAVGREVSTGWAYRVILAGRVGCCAASRLGGVSNSVSEIWRPRC